MARGRKTYMAESEIQKYEHADEARIGSVFFSEGVQQGAQHFVRLMRSYRIAANVAHSAWKLVEEMEKNGEPTIETWDELKARLHLFAPEAPAFRPPKPLAEFGCRFLEELYDYLSTWNNDNFTTGILMEQLFKKIEDARRELAL